VRLRCSSRGHAQEGQDQGQGERPRLAHRRPQRSAPARRRGAFSPGSHRMAAADGGEGGGGEHRKIWRKLVPADGACGCCTRYCCDRCATLPFVAHTILRAVIMQLIFLDQAVSECGRAAPRHFCNRSRYLPRGPGRACSLGGKSDVM
jgi:hypothetical protein